MTDDFDFKIEGGTRMPWEELYPKIGEAASTGDTMAFLIERKLDDDKTFSMESIEEAGQSMIGFILARTNHVWHKPDGTLGQAPRKAIITLTVRLDIDNQQQEES